MFNQTTFPVLESQRITEPIDRKKYFAQRIRSQRKHLGLTQKEVADKLEIPYQDYQKYEYAQIEPKRTMYDNICMALNLEKESRIHAKYRF